MARNRFEQVDEKQGDAITLSLWKAEDQMYGTVTVPSALTYTPMSPVLAVAVLIGKGGIPPPRAGCFFPESKWR